MAPGRVESNETLDRIENTMSRSTTRTVGPLSLTVCSPPSRRVAALRPRYAGLTALTPAARTVDRPLLPDRAGTGFLYRLLLTPNTPIFVAGRLHAPREILVRGRRDLSDRGEDLGEPGSPVPTRVVTGFILLPGRLHAPREILMHPLILQHQITPKTSRYTRCSMSMLPNVSINGRIRSSGQLGRWWYSISPCRNSECVRRFTVFAFNQRS